MKVRESELVIRRFRTPLLLLLLIAAQIFFLYAMMPRQPAGLRGLEQPEQEELVVRIARIDGNAVVTSPLGERNAVQDEKISLGEMIRTSPTTKTVITVEGLAEVLLGPASAMSFQSSQRGNTGLDLYLQEGTAYFILEMKPESGMSGIDTGLLTIHTPNMSCAALEPHRTEFLLSVEEEPGR